MKIDRRITNGLAWAGVFLVVGVPTADLLSAQLMGDAPAPQAAVIAPVTPVAAVAETAVTRPMPAPVSQRPAQVAAVEPVRPTAAPANATAVDNFEQSGRPLPSYITGGGNAAAAPAPAATKPAVAAPTQQATTTPAPAPVTAPTQQASTPPVRQPIVTAPAVDPIEVASIPPQQVKIAPVPMPLSMRPVARAPIVASNAPDLIIPDRVVAPLPPANVTASDLDDWESGPLSEFLAARQQGRGNAQADPSYDEDGFFLDEGPNAQRRQGNRLVGPAADEFYFPFGN